VYVVRSKSISKVKLIEQGRYDEAMKVENTFAIAIKEYEIPITGICLYKSIPVILNERVSLF
jgi:hypothetical protein